MSMIKMWNLFHDSLSVWKFELKSEEFMRDVHIIIFKNIW